MQKETEIFECQNLENADISLRMIQYSVPNKLPHPLRLRRAISKQKVTDRRAIDTTCKKMSVLLLRCYSPTYI